MLQTTGCICSPSRQQEQHLSDTPRAALLSASFAKVRTRVKFITSDPRASHTEMTCCRELKRKIENIISFWESVKFLKRGYIFSHYDYPAAQAGSLEGEDDHEGGVQQAEGGNYDKIG